MRNRHHPLWEEAFELMDRADRLQRQFFRFGGPGALTPRWEPPVDVFETLDGLIVIAALPGVDASRVEVLLEPGVLTIRAIRSTPRSTGATAIRRLEIPYGCFERRLTLPDTRYVIGAHEFRDGCLEIALKKRGERT